MKIKYLNSLTFLNSLKNFKNRLNNLYRDFTVKI